MIKRFALFVFLLLILQTASHAVIKVVAHPEVLQGRSFIVFVTPSNEVKGGSVGFMNRNYKLYTYEDGFRAIIPVGPEEKTGVFPVKVEAELNNGQQEQYETTILVSPYTYPKVSFWVKSSKKKLLTSRTVVDEWARIEKLLANERPEKLWDGQFLKPVPGITTMVFGTRELVNNMKRGQHRGWDFRAPVGTEILSTNRGIVVFADFLKAYGGTVVVDHGQGINTLYFHMSKILVKAGQEVSKSDLLGLSGNTGISSGPHVHWGMSVHNVRVDPKQWVLTVMP